MWSRGWPKAFGRSKSVAGTWDRQEGDTATLAVWGGHLAKDRQLSPSMADRPQQEERGRRAVRGCLATHPFRACLHPREARERVGLHKQPSLLNEKRPLRAVFLPLVVEARGLEPLTSSMPWMRSTKTELCPHDRPRRPTTDQNVKPPRNVDWTQTPARWHSEPGGILAGSGPKPSGRG